MPARASPSWWNSSLCGLVRFLSCVRRSGYLRMRWIGLIRYDSSVVDCCCRGFREFRKSCRAGLPSSARNDITVSIFYTDAIWIFRKVSL